MSLWAGEGQGRRRPRHLGARGERRCDVSAAPHGSAPTTPEDVDEDVAQRWGGREDLERLEGLEGSVRTCPTPLPTPGGRLVRKSRTPGVEPGGRTGDFLSRGGRACVGGMEVRIGGKSRRLARFESPRRGQGLLAAPLPRRARRPRALSLSPRLGSARLGSVALPVGRAAVVAPRARKKRVRARNQALKMETLLRGASPGVKRGRVEVVKYASRREI